jgi:hypothetical protein
MSQRLKENQRFDRVRVEGDGRDVEGEGRKSNSGSDEDGIEGALKDDQARGVGLGEFGWPAGWMETGLTGLSLLRLISVADGMLRWVFWAHWANGSGLGCGLGSL